MWCDNFDADLLKLIPNTPTILGDMADVKLWTYCDRPDGAKLHAPCSWHGPTGMIAFFGLQSHHFKSDAYYTDAPLVACTFLEACRDLWCHHALLKINGLDCIDFFALRSTMMQLLTDARQISVLPEADRTLYKIRVEGELAVGAGRLRSLCQRSNYPHFLTARPDLNL